MLRVFCGISGSASVPEIGFKKEQSLCLNRKMVNARLVLDAHAKLDAMTYYLANL